MKIGVLEKHLDSPCFHLVNRMEIRRWIGVFFSLFKRLKRCIKNLGTGKCKNKDEIHLELDGLEIDLERCFAYDKPHEVSVFVPRAELRKIVEKNGTREETEILLNSITVVHSPQRPSERQTVPDQDKNSAKNELRK
jgi:hypothetical protein